MEVYLQPCLLLSGHFNTRMLGWQDQNGTCALSQEGGPFSVENEKIKLDPNVEACTIQTSYYNPDAVLSKP